MDVAVVGGGVIGLAAAWRARQRGLESPCSNGREQFGTGASRAAAGMLAPVAEADLQERDLLLANLESRAPLAGVRGRAARRHRDRRRLPRLRHAAGRARPRRGRARRARARRCASGSACASSGCSAARRGASSRRWRRRCGWRSTLPDDHAVEPLRVVAALAEACTRAGVRVRTGVDVRPGDLAALPAERVVVAAGAWSGGARRARAGPAGQGPVAAPARPVRPGPAASTSCASKAATSSRAATAATTSARPSRSAGSTTAITALGVYELLREASEILPGRAGAGDRGGADRLPARGRPTTRR